MEPDAGADQPPGLPQGWLDAIDAVAAASVAPPQRTDAGLAAAIAAVSHTYTRDRGHLAALRGDPAAMAARLRFFLPRDMLKVWGPLAELAHTEALPPRTAWRVLDLGAGLGASSLGVLLWGARQAGRPGGGAWPTEVHIDAIDIDATALRLMAAVLDALRPRLPLSATLTGHEADLRRPDALQATAGTYDLILAGLTLNELEASGRGLSAMAEQVIGWSERLRPDGALVLIEPALRETSRSLQRLRDVLVRRDAAPFVHGPCLHAQNCPMLAEARDWCHATVPVPLPPRLQRMARAAGLRTEDLSYSVLTLRRVPRSTHTHAAHRYRVVSGPLRSKGKLERVLCGQAGLVRVMRLDRHAAAHNVALEDVERGGLLRMPTHPAAQGRLRLQGGCPIEEELSAAHSLRTSGTAPHDKP